jgi:hypothetical protein
MYRTGIPVQGAYRSAIAMMATSVADPGDVLYRILKLTFSIPDPNIFLSGFRILHKKSDDKKNYLFIAPYGFRRKF